MFLGVCSVLIILVGWCVFDLVFGEGGVDLCFLFWMVVGVGYFVVQCGMVVVFFGYGCIDLGMLVQWYFGGIVYGDYVVMCEVYCVVFEQVVQFILEV